jgi:hypothetical protein
MSVAPHPYLFAQTGLDSGALTMLGTVVHQITEPGKYRGTSTGPGGTSTAAFYLTVANEPGINQVNIDLATLFAMSSTSSGCDCASTTNHFVLGSHGYAVFHVSGGPGGHSVRLGRASIMPQAKDFDSTALTNGDLFAATILRPGTYKVINTCQKKAEPAELTVAYPKPGKTAYVPLMPLRVDCTEAGFSMAKMQLTAMQGCIFACKARSRIVIELVSTFDPPS